MESEIFSYEVFVSFAYFFDVLFIMKSMVECIEVNCVMKKANWSIRVFVKFVVIVDVLIVSHVCCLLCS